MVEAIERCASEVRWQVQPDAVERAAGGLGCLFGPMGLRLKEWLAAGLATVVKKGPHRTIYRVCLPEIDFYVKYYPLPDRRAWMRGLLRSSKARREYERALEVAARCVPTVEPLAIGEDSTSGPAASFYLTRTLPGAYPLDVYLKTILPTLGSRQSRMRQRLAVALGHFVALMHDAGILHHDLHPGNLLVCLKDEEPRLHLIDLLAVEVGPSLRWPTARANLVIFNRWFILRASRSDRLRFWHAYAQARRATITSCSSASAIRRAARDLEQRTVRSNLFFWMLRDRRCRSANRAFRHLNHNNLIGHAVADFSNEVLAPLLADPDAPFNRPGVKVLKRSPTSAVVELVLPGPDGPQHVIYKRFSVGKWTNPWAGLVRPTPTLHSYVMGHGLQLRELPTPRPLAVWHRYRLGLPREGYLLTEKVPAAMELHEALACLQSQEPADARRRLRPLIAKVARLISTLHQRFLSHRDLKAANILVSHLLEEDNRVALWLIDLVGVRRHGKLSRRRRIQNLARLNVSFQGRAGLTRTDKLRFLRTYLRWGLQGRMGWKHWWHQVEQATEVKVRRNLRNGRPLN